MSTDFKIFNIGGSGFSANAQALVVYNEDMSVLYSSGAVTTYSNVACADLSSDGKWLALSRWSGTPQLSIWSINQETGVPSVVHTQETFSNVLSVKFSKCNNFLVLIPNTNQSTSIRQYSFNQETGAVTQIQLISFSRYESPDSKYSRCGNFLYVAERVTNENNIHCYSLNKTTGQLSLASTYSESIAISDSLFDISRDNKYLVQYLYVSTTVSIVRLFEINQTTGALTYKSQITPTSTLLIRDVVFSPDNKWIIIFTGKDTINAYKIDTENDTLSERNSFVYSAGGFFYTTGGKMNFSFDNSLFALGVGRAAFSSNPRSSRQHLYSYNPDAGASEYLLTFIRESAILSGSRIVNSNFFWPVTSGVIPPDYIGTRIMKPLFFGGGL